jgi:hypothetical protein
MMTEPLDMLRKELAAHSVRVNPDGGVVVFGSGEDVRHLSVAEAVTSLRSAAAENADYLVKLWHRASTVTRCEPGHHRTTASTQRMFASAVKHLVKRASANNYLSEYGLDAKLGVALQRDVASYSQQQMDEVIDSRLAIDWMEHLVGLDHYRADLLETYAAVRDSGRPKLAYGPSARNFDNENERAIPWEQYKDTLMKHRSSPNEPGTEESLLEQNREFHVEDGQQDQSEHGFLDEFDEIAHGVNFKKRRRSTMYDLWLKNQKMRDPRGAQEGARPWGSTDVNPHEVTLKR